MKTLIEENKQDIKILEQENKSLQEENIKIRSNYENTLLSANSENSAQVDKLKKIILENEKKITGFEKAIA